jgi:uncharacterized protein YkwD
MRRLFLLISFFTLILTGILGGVSPVFGAVQGPIDMLDAVNALRQENGLSPYEFDAGLMASAQVHADYMAEIGEITHVRADGSGPEDLGFFENVAGGQNLTIQVAIYSLWSDPDHWSTMVGMRFGKAGVGVAEKDGIVYYVLQVKKVQTGLEGQPTPDYNVTADPQLVNPVITVTPQLDGSIIHEVLDGQSLWSIATTYGITIAEIIQWNNLAPTPVIFPGERLLVQPQPTATTTPTITLTPIPATRTPTPTMTPKTPTATPTITMTPTITPKPPFSVYNLEKSQRSTVGILLVALCGLGLLTVVYFGFIRK